MNGVQFMVDSHGNKTGVVINPKKHGRLWEEIYDNWLAEQRKHEPASRSTQSEIAPRVKASRLRVREVA